MNKARTKYISGLILFGLNGIISSRIILSSMDIVFYRTLTGSVFLILLCLYQSRGSRHHNHDTGLQAFASADASNGISIRKSDEVDSQKSGLSQQSPALITDDPRQLAAVVMSGISMGLSWLFLYEAYRRIGVGLSSITYYCGPVIVMMLSPLVFRSRLTGRQIICFAAAFAGILMVSLPGVTGDAKVDVFGLICGFASALLHALMVIFTMKAPDITGMVNSAIQLAVSFITIALPAAVVWLICAAGHSPGTLTAVFGSSLALPDGLHQWFWVLFLGIVNTGVGCWLYFSEIAALPVTTVSLLGYLEPLSAVFFAVLLLGESMTVWEWAGAAMILGSAAISDIGSSRCKDTGNS